jgi:hypothetical protein
MLALFCARWQCAVHCLPLSHLRIVILALLSTRRVVDLPRLLLAHEGQGPGSKVDHAFIIHSTSKQHFVQQEYRES